MTQILVGVYYCLIMFNIFFLIFSIILLKYDNWFERIERLKGQNSVVYISVCKTVLLFGAVLCIDSIFGRTSVFCIFQFL